jgi:hypothetical protein
MDETHLFSRCPAIWMLTRIVLMAGTDEFIHKGQLSNRLAKQL